MTCCENCSCCLVSISRAVGLFILLAKLAAASEEPNCIQYVVIALCMAQ
jgi:hypothetical protein